MSAPIDGSRGGHLHCLPMKHRHAVVPIHSAHPPCRLSAAPTAVLEFVAGSPFWLALAASLHTLNQTRSSVRFDRTCFVRLAVKPTTTHPDRWPQLSNWWSNKLTMSFVFSANNYPECWCSLQKIVRVAVLRKKDPNKWCYLLKSLTTRRWVLSLTPLRC